MLKKRLKTFIDVIYTLFFYLIVGCAVHELFHYLIGTWLGWQASVSFPSLFTGWTTFPQWSIIPLSNVILIALAGGGITCLMMIGMAYFTEDWEQSMVLYFIAPLQGIYSLFELGYVLHYFDIKVLSIVPCLLTLPISLYLIKRKNYQTNQ